MDYGKNKRLYAIISVELLILFCSLIAIVYVQDMRLNAISRYIDIGKLYWKLKDSNDILISRKTYISSPKYMRNVQDIVRMKLPNIEDHTITKQS